MKLSNLLGSGKKKGAENLFQRLIKKEGKKILIRGITIVALPVVILAAVDYTTEITSAKNTPKKIYDKLEIESIEDLVEIKENDDGEYYLGFKDGIDDKLSDLIEYAASTAGIHNLPNDVDILKNMLKAEVVTQFPNLGGEIPDGSDGFQGAVKIRRVTPDKEIGELKNTGSGETTTVETDGDEDINGKSDYEDTVKNWKAGKKLTLSKDVTVYEQTKADDGSDTGDWHAVYNSKVSGDLTFPSGAEVEYTGTYKSSKNLMSEKAEAVTYIEVKYKDKTGYIKAEFVVDNDEENDNSKSSSITRKIASLNTKVTSRAKTKKTVADKDKEYTIAIAAGHNNIDKKGASYGNLKEEELTIKVAEKVEKLFEDYSNVKVVQTGSTRDNPGGIKNSDRKRLAREANPDLCIQIHFNAGGGTGVEAIYKEGDGYSQQLAEILSKSLASSMKLKNRGAGTDVQKTAKHIHLGVIENYATSGFPSVLTEGGFIDGDAKLVGTDEGIEAYAKGIVNGVIEYLEADHSGLTATSTESEKVNTSVKSKVKNLKYVPKDVMDKYIKDSDTEALNVFTLDEDNKVITATWSETNDKITISTNAAMDLKTALQKYAVPYEYMLMFYIDTNDPDFLNDFADLVLSTDIVMVVQDNVTTVSNTETKQIREEEGDWQDTSEVKNTSTESVNTVVDFTYIKAWCVKAYKKNSYSDKALNMGDNDEISVDISGKVDEADTNSVSEEQFDKKISKTRTKEEKDSATGQVSTVSEKYEVKQYKRTQTDTKTISNTYESGDLKVEEKTDSFIKLYKDTKEENLVRAGYLFHIIEGNEKTANFLDLTKYLLYKATGISYGVVTYNFDEFGINSFSGAYGIYGNTVQEKVWFSLRSAGFSEYATAGVMGNIEAESGYNESLIEKGSGNGFGLCQWSFGRRTQLENYAKSKGVSPSDINTQIEFLIGEITPGGGANGYANYQIMNNKGYTANDWKNANSPEKAAEVFCYTFERPGIPRLSVRTDAARKYYEEFKGKTAPSLSSESTLTGDNATKMTALIQDAIRIANDDRYLYSQKKRDDEFYYDCSSLVAKLYRKHFGFTAPGSTSAYTSQYRIGKDGSVTLQPGDVLWREGHVEIYIGNGQKVGAHSDKKPPKDQISVTSYKPGKFTYVYRFIQ